MHGHQEGHDHDRAIDRAKGGFDLSLVARDLGIRLPDKFSGSRNCVVHALTAYEFRFDSQTQKLSRMAEPEMKVITVPGKKFT